MLRSLRRVLICCSAFLAGTLLLAGPGLHLLSPCDHGHTTHQDDRPDRSLDGAEDCPVCSLVAEVSTTNPASLIAPDAIRADRPDPLPLPLLLDEPGRVRLPRSPPIA